MVGGGTGIEACCGTDGGNAGDASVTGAGAGAPLTGECLFGSSAGAGGIGPTDGSDGGGAGGCPGTVAAGRDGSASSGGCCIGVGGGGGGGWFGGGEGGLVGGGGGGGSSYGGAGPSSITTASSSQSPEVVIRWTLATPSISTQQQPAATTVGGSIADQATVSGGYHPTGTVTFSLLNNANGKGKELFTDTEPLSNGSATSAQYTTTATGTDYWVATYNGDGNNSPVSSSTSGEPVSITPAAPSIGTSQQPAAATVGSSIADTATVSGGDNPTGTVTFSLLNNPNGKGKELFTDTEPLSNGSATSAQYTTTATGTDYWIATYNGDATNASVNSNVNGEPVTITPATPSIATSQQPAAATVGSSIADQATVSGGDSPAGRSRSAC